MVYYNHYKGLCQRLYNIFLCWLYNHGDKHKLALKPFIDNGEMEYIQWSPLSEYPQGIVDTNSNVYFASLVDNIFNKSKSNIKMIEAGALGLPGAYQDLCTYDSTTNKFKNGADLINQLEVITSNVDTYMKMSVDARKFAEGLWLEDHLDEYVGLYLTPVLKGTTILL